MLHVKRFIGSYKLRFLYLVFSSVNYEDLPETAIKKLPKRPRLRLTMTGLTGTITFSQTLIVSGLVNQNPLPFPIVSFLHYKRHQ